MKYYRALLSATDVSDTPPPTQRTSKNIPKNYVLSFGHITHTHIYLYLYLGVMCACVYTRAEIPKSIEKRTCSDD